MDDPEHARIRRMLTAHFTIRRTEAMRPMIQDIVDGLLDRLIAEGPPADLVADFAFPLPSQVIAVMLEVSDADFAEFQRASQGVMDFTVSSWRSPATMFVWSVSRRAPMARLRRDAMAGGAVQIRTREASSVRGVPGMVDLFSMPQRSRTRRAISVASACAPGPR
ncbi:cytochrome P450 [Streptomyces sp. 5-10]|uniref:cytochrome P450 n=1 Tax=Streptomyces sp. 5-10 TaxID=878925 RepID=UPI00168BC1CB|nr:cytochrome P450 [Streptomyces sp. 5-10]MBD3006619.1 cytochrome P450 [Streptomyces sp. 5-10]